MLGLVRVVIPVTTALPVLVMLLAMGVTLGGWLDGRGFAGIPVALLTLAAVALLAVAAAALAAVPLLAVVPVMGRGKEFVGITMPTHAHRPCHHHHHHHLHHHYHPHR